MNIIFMTNSYLNIGNLNNKITLISYFCFWHTKNSCSAENEN